MSRKRDSIEALAAFWDTHDLTDFDEQLQVVKGSVFVRDNRRNTNAATRELLAIPGFEKSFIRGVKDTKAKRVKPWRQSKRRPR